LGSSVKKDLIGAVGQQLGADAGSECRRVAPWTARLAAHRTAAIERYDGTEELELVAVNRRRQRTDRRLTAAAESGDECPFRGQGVRRGRIVDAGHDAPDLIVAGADLDGYDALSG
jgi:hypothetical protein